MKNWMKALTLSALLFSTTALAEPYWAQKPIQCSSQEELIERAKSEGELPTIIFNGNTMGADGTITGSRFVFATNKETETWTLMEFPYGGKQGCILGRGIGQITFGDGGVKT